MRRAVFLDRDGLLIEDTGYVHKLSDLKIKVGVIAGLKRLQKDFLLFIVTNQSGLGRGLYGIDEYTLFQNALIAKLNEREITITKTYYCPHDPAKTSCECRKPSPFFLRQAEKEFGIDLKQSYMVGDRNSDVETGHNAGTKTVLVRMNNSDPTRSDAAPSFHASAFLDAVKWVLAQR